MDLQTWGTQGCAIDHRPVQAIITVQTLQEKGLPTENKGRQEIGGFTGNNRILIKAYETHIKMCENQFRVKQKEIGQEELQTLQQIQGTVKLKIGEKWNQQQNANEMQQAIDEAMKETYDELCREQQKQQKKREYISEDTLENINKKKRTLGRSKKMVESSRNTRMGATS